ncbi:AarF/ABC1/UbiB kinase family protein [Candidatus Chloroploca sp. M-50]|uniref:AarF/ABC1/UbiB kinase family protein n=1 Tax=Candidatus Chloroploca mongolica TaxID=2528176 RepID=A0ABS4D791_9CHLR|nr:AarF/ABC1/UbiB kinase family protein [Candidatus Chloroploca mongolica]MBP1465306.1 AarF/ABC1/UbiB kinase family protein [Candidatus Chloroploca mongolica]
MWPLVRQARYLGRYREITQVLVGHGFGALVEQLGLISLLSLPRRAVLRVPPTPPLGTAGRLREALVALGPTFVKLGQAFSTRPDLLPPEFVTELGKLQDTVPSFPAEVAIATIEECLGRPVDQIFASFDPVPLAAASLGQVHAAQLHTGEKVVVKVQRPDIAGRINTDLAILADLAVLAQERLPLGQQYNLIELTWEFTATLRAELDYRREGRNADRFRRLFAEHDSIYIPQIYWEYSGSKVLTSERLYGVKVTDHVGLEAAGIDRVGLARNCLALILREIFTFGFFHSDPHPGNFFAMPGEVLGVVDYGQMGSLDAHTTHALLLLLTSMVDQNTDGTIRSLERLGLITRREITPQLQRDLERFTQGFVDRPLCEISAQETINELLSLLRRHHIRLPGPLALLMKALVMMEGVGLQLDPQLDVFGIARPYVEKAILEDLAPANLGNQALRGVRDLGEVAVELPYQASDLIHRLNSGELRIQTEERELRRVAGALVGAANRLAVAVVLAALILGIGMLAVAIGIGGWTGVLPNLLLGFSVAAFLLTGVALVFALLRRWE